MRCIGVLVMVIVGLAVPIWGQAPTTGSPEKPKPAILIVHPEARQLAGPGQLIKELSALGVGLSTAADHPWAKADVKLEAIVRIHKQTKFEGVEALTRLLEKGGVERLALAYQDEPGIGITLIADKQVRAGGMKALLEDLRHFQKRHNETTTFALKTKSESESEGSNPFDAADETEPERSRKTRTANESSVYDRLKAPVSVHIHGASLTRLLKEIQKQANVNLIIDEEGFKEAGVIETPAWSVSLDADDIPLERVLAMALEPHKLGYFVEGDTVRVTSERRIPRTAAALKAKYLAEERAIAELARQIRESPDESRRSQLRARVAKAFALRQAQQQAELKEFQERMARVQKTIESREQARERIIDRRVEELLNPDVDWDAAMSATASPRSSEGSESMRSTPASAEHGPLPEPAADPAAAQPQSDSALRPIRLEFVGGEKKHPVPDLTVRLVRIDPKLGRVKGGIGEADDKGVVRLSLAPANYAATVESKQPLRYLPIPVGWKEHPAYADFYFKVEPGGSEQAFTRHLASPCELTLRAVDEATGKGLAGAVFATENALGEYWAQVINADTLGAPQLRESDFTDETVQTDSEGNFRRGLGPRPGWKYMVWRSPPGYEPVEPGKEVDVETPLGQATAEYTFKFRKIKAD